jgi:hypothetical protein
MKEFLRTTLSSFKDLLPIILVIAFFQVLVLGQPLPNVIGILAGLVMVVLGLTFFVFGLEMALFPIGETMAHAFARKGSVFWLILFAFFLGFGTTIAEPALIAVSAKAGEIAAGGAVIANNEESIASYAFGLRLSVALSVGIAIVLGVLRILKGWPIHKMIMLGYLLVVVMTYFAPPEIIGIAYDSGGVCHGLWNVLLMHDFILNLITNLANTVKDVAPIILILAFFQFAVLRQQVPNIKAKFIGLTFVILGLSLFLMGLEQALFPLGELMATQLTQIDFIDTNQDGVIHWLDYKWVYLFAFAIGFSTTIAEPSLLAVAIKANEVSGGAIGMWGLRLAVALGVGIGITLGVYRIVVGDPIHYYIIAGYIIVVLQTPFAPKMIIPLAYDSGGVTTSTVTVPLVAALGLGLASTIEGRSPLIDGFGLIAFASLFPIISVMAYAQLIEYIDKKSRS